MSTTTAERSLLRDGNFATFWTGQTISALGAQLGLLAFPVLAVSLLGATEMEVGALNAASTAAFLVVGLPAGAWVDRWLKRRVMIAADLVRMAAMAAVPLLWWLGVLAMWQLYVVAAVVGVATVFFDVSYQSIVPLLVRTSKVAEANAKLEGTAQVSRVGGPALGGGLLTIMGAPLLFLGEGLGYLLSAVFLWRTRVAEVPQPVADRRPLAAEIKEGLAFVVKHPLISRIVLCTAGFNAFSTITFTLLPILVLRELGLGAGGLGLVLSVGAAGGLLGALAAPWLGRVVGEGTLIPLSALAGAVPLVLVPATLLAGSHGLALVMLVVAEFLASFATLVYNIMQVTMRQRVCPPRLLGRMNASIRFAVFGVMPLAALLAGLLGQSLGLAGALWVAAAGGLLPPLAVFFSPLLGMKRLPDSVDPAHL
ncbi:MFS transporter [Arthrobacter sp. 35W]|uniref:MFS transporter n=1 Tax=Arthrobacter sp. 35W TaxID=1132441 RepID=UPI00047DC1DB|nr:MFS transporter [Arthrobacter sp. 35W]